MHARTLTQVGLAAGTVLATGAAGIGYAMLEARAYTLRRFTVPVLPPGSPTLRLLHLSDIHLVPRQHRKAAWVHQLGELSRIWWCRPGTTSPRWTPSRMPCRRRDRFWSGPGCSCWARTTFEPRPKNPARYLVPRGGRRIVGGTLPTDDLVKGFRTAGWLDLTNQRGSLTVRGLRLDFVGVDDPHMRRDRYGTVSRPHDPAAALTVGVAHAPYRRVLDAMSADGAQLLLAGHTHGGQLCLPGFGTLVTNCDIPRRQAKGISRWPSPHGPDAWLHVSAGVGTSPYTPIRFACRPEASLLMLTPRQDH